MCQVRFISDYHFGHEICAVKHRGFKNAEVMNQHIIDRHNEIVNKKDLTYILGDITMENPKFYHLLDEMNGRKIVILGNHDPLKHVRKLLNYVENVAAMVKYKGIFLTHVPVHPQELEYRVSKNIHGHLHEYNVVKEIVKGTRETLGKEKDERYINVSCEQVNYQPKTLKELGVLR